MSTTAHPKTRCLAASPALFAVAGAGLSVALTGYGTFKEDNLPGDLPVWLFGNLSIIAVATVLVFAVFVRRALRQHDPAPIARISLVLGLLAVATIVVFFSGLPCVLAAAAVCTALAARERAGGWTAVPRVAVALSTVAVILAVFLAITG
jgi:hypothetical protein